MAATSASDNPRFFMNDPDFSYWNDTNDDILTEFKTLMTIAEHRERTGGEYGQTLRTLQRFAELVDMIMYLQRVPFFGQYWYYGCWCAPEGFLKTVGSGFGKPVDDIDRSCQHMSECYECAQMDYGEDCTTAEVNYRWHGEFDDQGGKFVSCDDPEDSCAWAICQCDKKLAEDLRYHERQWNLHHHQKWGDFNRDDACYPNKEKFDGTAQQVGIETESAATNAETYQTSNAGAMMNDAGWGNNGEEEEEEEGTPTDAPTEAPDVPIWARSLSFDGPGLDLVQMPSLKLKLAGEFGNKNVKQCCGKYPERFPFRLGHNTQCCSNVSPFNVLYSRCCDDGSVKNLGEECE